MRKFFVYTLITNKGKLRLSDMSARPHGAYTIIELLVALSIAAILFVGGFAAYQDLTRRETLNGAADELVTNVNLVRQRAVSGEKPTGCTGSLRGYEVVFNASSYVASAICDSATESRSFPLPTGISLSPTGNTVLFKVLGQGTNLSSDLTITLTQNSTGNQKNVRITTDGRAAIQ